MYNLAKISQEETKNLNRQIIPNEIEAVIKKLLTSYYKGHMDKIGGDGGGGGGRWVQLGWGGGKGRKGIQL